MFRDGFFIGGILDIHTMWITFFAMFITFCVYLPVMQVTQIFTDTLRELRMGTRRIGHQGGQYSGKTVNILPALATLCSEETDGSVTTVTSMNFPHLKGGALRDFEMFVFPHFRDAIKKYHKTDHLFTFKSGSLLEFRAFENEMSARGHKRKRLFVNEANKMDYQTFFQLDSRSDQTIIDYNPSARFWAHEKLIGQTGNKWFYSDHRHNPFLSAEKHAEIEAYTGELFRVYSRGLTGNIKGVIFPDWEMIDDEDFPIDLEWVFSVDFGYTNDPTCVIKQGRIGDTIFIKELLYKPGASPIEIIQILKANGWKDGYTPFYCEHDPDMIRDLRKHGALYADPARKGQGSVNAGIELLKRHKVRYSNSSQNLHREIGLYVWEEDKKTGEPTNYPVDRNNHAMDSIRYGAYSRYLKSHTS